MCETDAPEPSNEEEARVVVGSEASDAASATGGENTWPHKAGTLALLGGWESRADYELQDHVSGDEVAGPALSENRNPEANSTKGTHACDRNTESGDPTGRDMSGFQDKTVCDEAKD